jgi:hypothetical protein
MLHASALLAFVVTPASGRSGPLVFLGPFRARLTHWREATTTEARQDSLSQ